MADWHVTPEQAETAKVIASGAFGASVLVYVRHPGSLARAAFMVLIGIGMASVFSAPVTEIINSIINSLVGPIVKVGPVHAGAVLGMLGLVIARKLIDWVEKLDLSALLPWRKS